MDRSKFKELVESYKSRYSECDPTNLSKRAEEAFNSEQYTTCFDKLSELSHYRQNQDARIMNNIACLLGRSFAPNFNRNTFDLNRSSALAWAKHFEDLCNWLLKGYTCEVAQMFFTPTPAQRERTILSNLNVFYNRAMLLMFGGEMESAYQLLAQVLEIFDLQVFSKYPAGPQLMWLFRECVVTLGYSHLLDETTSLLRSYITSKKSISPHVDKWKTKFIDEKLGGGEKALIYLKLREEQFYGLAIRPNPNFKNSINKSLVDLEKFFKLIAIDNGEDQTPSKGPKSIAQEPTLARCLKRPLLHHLQVVYYNNKGCIELLSGKPFQAGFYFILANNTHFTYLDAHHVPNAIYPSLNYEIDYNHSLASLMSQRYREPRSVFLAHVNANTVWRCDPYLWLRLGEATRLLDVGGSLGGRVRRLREALNFFLTGRTFVERSLVFRKEALSLIPEFDRLISETCDLLDGVMRGRPVVGAALSIDDIEYAEDSDEDDDDEEDRGRGKDFDEDGRVVVVNERGEITHGENVLDGDDPSVIKVVINPTSKK